MSQKPQPIIFEIGDEVTRNEAFFKSVFPCKDDRCEDNRECRIPPKGLVTSVLNLPEVSWKNVGHKQWIGINGGDHISAAFYDPNAAFGGLCGIWWE